MIAPGILLQNRYLVERQIGQGGMGAVFVATDQRFGSRVALKETFFTDGNLRRGEYGTTPLPPRRPRRP